MNILVTGAAGYIGTVLCDRLLACGNKVIAVDSLRHNNGQALLGLLGRRGFQFHHMDVQDYLPLARLADTCDAIVPLAALVGMPLCKRFPEEARSINHLAVAHLADGLSPHQRLVYPNTNSGYGQTDGTRAVTEADPMCPISVYGETKCKAEEAVLNHPLGVSLRLATVFGTSPRMRFDLLVNHFTERLVRIKEVFSREGRHAYRPLEIYEPEFLRNYVHVQDVARAFCWAIADHRMRGAYNVGLPDANLSKLELAQKVAALLELQAEQCIYVGTGTDPDQRNYKVSSERLLKTGFSFQHSLESGILEVAQAASLLMQSHCYQMRNA